MEYMSEKNNMEYVIHLDVLHQDSKFHKKDFESQDKYPVSLILLNSVMYCLYIKSNIYRDKQIC